MKRLIILVAVLTASLAAGTALAAPANLSLSGPKQVGQGQMFQVTVQAANLDKADTIRLNGSYSSNVITWQQSQPGSFANVSPGTSVDASKGTFSFGAFTLSNPLNGSSKLVTLTFRAKQVGTATISLDNTSRVLADGVEQTGTLGSITIKVVAAPQPTAAMAPTVGALTVFSPTHPNPELWYNKGDVTLSWKVTGKTVKSYYYGFDQSPAGAASQKTTATTVNLKADRDGVWYAHVIANYTDNTSDRADFPIRIDRQPPHQPQPSTEQALAPCNLPNSVMFGTTDDVSGIANYIVSVDGKVVATTLAPSLALPVLPAGMHTISVEVVDQAGNRITGQTSFEVTQVAAAAPPSPTAQIIAKVAPWWTGWWARHGYQLVILIEILIVLILIGLLWKRFGTKKTHRRG